MIVVTDFYDHLCYSKAIPEYRYIYTFSFHPSLGKWSQSQEVKRILVLWKEDIDIVVEGIQEEFY